MPFRYRRAIVRRPSANYHRGLTTGEPGTGDIARFDREHRAYVDALTAAGLDVIVLEPLDAYPDAHFVEDVAVIVPELVVITRPGAPSRRDETRHIEPALRSCGQLARIEAPGTLDGGDVLVIGRRCYIGLSARSNAEGVRQLTGILEAYGYACTAIPVEAGLHLKSSVNALAEDSIIVTRDLMGHDAFRSYRKVVVDSEETYAANALRVNDRLLVAEGYPRMVERLTAFDVDAAIVTLDVGEARRMDGGLTCLSLRY
jgi:dimethylargininase